jgi:hypothetical protein
MRHSIAVGMCWLIVAFAPGCPKDDKQGGDTTVEDGGSSSRGQTMSGVGHGMDASHSGAGGSAANNGGSGDGGKSGGSGSGAHDAGVGHDPNPGMTDAGSGSGGDMRDAGTDAGDMSCDLKCDSGSHCELVQVECIRAPCPPQQECVKDADKQFCGGFAGFDCPGGGTCVDDPSDDCDPMNGGADCGGMCLCDKAASCVKGKHWNGLPSVCACVDDSAGTGGSCGSKTCPQGESCCNASCGICAPPGGACTQQACL